MAGVCQTNRDGATATARDLRQGVVAVGSAAARMPPLPPLPAVPVRPGRGPAGDRDVPDDADVRTPVGTDRLGRPLYACPFSKRHRSFPNLHALTNHVHASHDPLYTLPGATRINVRPPVQPLETPKWELVYAYCGTPIGPGERCRQPIQFNEILKVSFCRVHNWAWQLESKDIAAPRAR